MQGLLAELIAQTFFIPHGHCYLWLPRLVSLHLIADFFTTLAYYIIALILIYFVQKRPDLPYPWIFLLFGTFIIACGTTHAMEIWTLWHPDYWLAGSIKAGTAIVSMFTAITMFPLFPKVLALPSPRELAETNQQLQHQIRERQQAEEALQKSEARLAGILDVAQEAIISIDVNQKITLFNQGAEKIFGYTTNAILGQKLDLLLPTRYKTIHEQHIQQFRQDSDVTRPMGKRREIFGRRQNGTEFPAEASLSKLELGDEIIFTVILRDISERKQVEKQMKLQDIIFKNMAEGICLVKAADSTIVYVNPKFEQMFGYEPGELLGQNVSILNYQDKRLNAKAVALEITNHLDTHGEYTYEVYNVKKDGTPFWCRATSSRFEHPDYGIVYVAVQADINDLKQAEAEARAALEIRAILREKEASLKEKEVLLKEIHHRVKNNLQIVNGLLQLQARRTDNQQALSILLESQHRIKSIALVHEKLYLSDDLAKIDFVDYISSLTSSLIVAYQNTANRIALTTDVEEIALDIDTAIPCGLIINELVTNALKHAFPEEATGAIKVSLYRHREQQSQLILQVKDNGIGLPKDIDLQATNSLGLKLVQGLVSQLDGVIKFEDQQGTTVTIIFTNPNDLSE